VSDDLLARATAGDGAAFEVLVAGQRRELSAYAYRMLGSFHDAEDAVQETLLAAWRGLGAFQARSSVRTWLYRICTNVCLRHAARARARRLTPDLWPARENTADLGEAVEGPWVEPYPAADDSAVLREGVELAWVAALQHLSPIQRAVLVLREVLEFAAAEVARMLETTVAAVNSALQRARATMQGRASRDTQSGELTRLGDAGVRRLVEQFVRFWEAADIDGITALLTEDVRLAMPPLPAWFDGLPDVRRFFTERIFATSWRLLPVGANGQLAFACYQQNLDGMFVPATVTLVELRGAQIAGLTSFCDPASYRSFELPATLSEELSDLR
jgi:RNA polymerase sigma-70 factor (ECF subfamily)